jgi:putative Ca2+/H+ antiporter (TMEM165/GDT1 family)
VEAFLSSLGIVALAELGDKTQLLSFVLAARFRRAPGPIIAGIFVATIANHAAAAFVGETLAGKLDVTWMKWILGFSFLAFAVWALIPDKLDETPPSKHGAFITTIVLFFLAEMGDKTQLATVALGAQYRSVALVTLGTTIGMMVANVPAVLIGDKLVQRFPLSKMRFVAAALFAAFGLWVLFAT